MTDPRRKIVAEAMEAHDGEEWRSKNAYHASEGCMIIGARVVASRIKHAAAHSMVTSHHALPVAVELIEELTAELSRESYTLRRAVERAQNAEATIATQAKEIERLTGLAYFGEHHFPDLTWKARCEEQAKEIERLRAKVFRMNNDLVRPDGCVCQWEAGDSPCPVHGEEDR